MNDNVATRPEDERAPRAPSVSTALALSRTVHEAVELVGIPTSSRRGAR